MILIVDRRETVLRYAGGSIRLEQRGYASRRVPIRQLDQVIVYGNPLAETAVWRALAEAGVPVVMLTSRGQDEVAMLGSGLATQLPLRRMQHGLAGDPTACVAMACRFVVMKVRSMTLALHTLVQLHPVAQQTIEAFTQLCDRTCDKLRDARDINEAMGLEGALARGWFNVLADALPAELKFTGRNRRPPRDPVNALLSLGYTLLMSEVRHGIVASGFDPSLGFLHQDTPGRESLVLDFAEIFRSGVDSFVLRWLHETPVGRDSFYYRDDEGCRLSKAARPLFFDAWARYREDWPRPFAAANSEDSEWPTARLREQVMGQVAAIREVMKAMRMGNV